MNSNSNNERSSTRRSFPRPPSIFSQLNTSPLRDRSVSNPKERTDESFQVEKLEQRMKLNLRQKIQEKDKHLKQITERHKKMQSAYMTGPVRHLRNQTFDVPNPGTGFDTYGSGSLHGESKVKSILKVSKHFSSVLSPKQHTSTLRRRSTRPQNSEKHARKSSQGSVKRESLKRKIVKSQSSKGSKSRSKERSKSQKSLSGKIKRKLSKPSNYNSTIPDKSKASLGEKLDKSASLRLRSRSPPAIKGTDNSLNYTPNMFEMLPSRETDGDNFSLRLKKVTEESQAYKTADFRATNIHQRIEATNFDISNLRHRLRKGKDELILVHQEKSEVLHQLQLSEQLTYQIKMDLEYGKKEESSSLEMTKAHKDIDFQKEQNQKLQKQVSDYNNWTGQNQYEICKAIEDQNVLKLEARNEEQDFALKLTDIELLKQRDGDVVRNIEQQQKNIKYAEVEEQEVNMAIKGLESQIDSLAEVRMAILDEYENANQEVMVQQKDIHADQTIIKRQTGWESKLAAARILFFDLQLAQDNIKCNSFEELRLFKDFDQQCMRKLTSFNVVMVRMGRSLKQQAVQRWYDNAFKPIKIISLNILLADQLHSQKIKQRIFSTWKTYHDAKIESYKSKGDSIGFIWCKLFTGYQSEQKRAIAIWKGCVLHKAKKERTVKILILKAVAYKKLKVMQIWNKASKEVNQLARIELCKRDYAQKFYICSLFQALKEQVFTSKVKKHRLMRKAMFNLKKYQCYRREITRLNMQAIKLLRINMHSTMLHCFSGIKNYKEHQKYKIMNKALKTDLEVAITGLSAFKTDFTSTKALQQKTKAVTAIKTQIAKRLFSYFQTWVAKSQDHKNILTRVKDFLIRVHNLKRKKALDHWKNNATRRVIQRARLQIQTIEEGNLQIENENLEASAENKSKGQAVSSLKKKFNGRVFKKFLKRRLSQALNRWRDHVQGMNNGFDKQNVLLSKMRSRLLRESFEIYKTTYLKSISYQMNDKKAINFENTRTLRTLRLHFNAFCAFTGQHDRSKRKMKKLLFNLELVVQRNFLKLWRINIELKKEVHLKVFMEEQSMIIEEKNQGTAEAENRSAAISKELKEQTLALKKKGRLQIGNYFMRYYMSSIEDHFKRWKYYRNKKQQQEAVAKRTLLHWRTYQFMQVKSAFQQLRHSQNIGDFKEKINRQLLLQDEQVHLLDQSSEQFAIAKIRQKKDLVQSMSKNNQTQKKLVKSHEMMARKNLDQVFVSRKRQVFEEWRFSVRVQKSFIQCVVGVLTKSMFHAGFQATKNASKSTNRHEVLTKRLNQIGLRLSKRFMLQRLNKWKQEALFTVNKSHDSALTKNQEASQKMKYKVKSIKKQNCQNIEHYFHKKHLKHLFESWLKSIEYMQTRRIQNSNIAEILNIVRKRRPLQKWIKRVECTKKVNFNVQTMRRNHKNRVQKLVLIRLKQWVSVKSRLTNSFFNFANMMRDKSLIQSFKTLQAFEQSMFATHQNFKAKSTIDIFSLLSQIHTKRLRKAFMSYRHIVSLKVQKGRKASMILKKVQNHDLRDAFRKWAFVNSKQNLVVELNEVGPVTEYVFEANRLIGNLKAFMKSENIHSDEIKKRVENADQRNEHKMRWVVKRLQVPKQNRIICRCFEHWIMWLKVRKIMKYYLRLGNCNVQYSKCDMRRAFDIWKRSDPEQVIHLSRKPTVSIKALSIKQSDNFNDLADKEAASSLNLSHFNQQREDLVLKLIHGQKLAQILLRDNQIKYQGRAFTRWKNFYKKAQEIEGEVILSQHVDHMSKLKQIIQQLKDKNDEITGENAEFTEFSLETFDTALQVHDLSIQRDQFKNRLLEAEEEIYELLTEQADLREKLEKVNKIIEVQYEERSPERIVQPDFEQHNVMAQATIVRQRSLTPERNVSIINPQNRLR